MKPNIQVYKNLQELSVAAADLFVDSGAQAIALAAFSYRFIRRKHAQASL